MNFLILSIKGIWRTMVFAVVSLLPRDRKLAVFGAWKGDRYCDNPKYMMLYLLDHSDYKCVWVGKEELRNQMPSNGKFRFVLHDSWSAVLVALRARFVFTCRWDEDVSSLCWQGGATRINLWHGIPLKFMGVKTPFFIKHHAQKTRWEEFRHRVFDLIRPLPYWTSTASHGMSQIMVECFPDKFSHERIWEWGTPRNDFIIRNSSNMALRNKIKDKYSALLGFPADKKVVLYMPTWRMSGKPVFTFFGMDVAQRKKMLTMLDAHDAVIVEKHHHVILENSSVDSLTSGGFIVIGSKLHNEVDPQELYLITDILVTDYSSAYIDYALLGRPCIHFTYDYEDYKNGDSGLAYDLKQVAAGRCVETYDELYTELERKLNDATPEPMPGFQDLVACEKGECASQIQGFMESV